MAEEDTVARFEGSRTWRTCPACADVVEHENDPGGELTCEVCGYSGEGFQDDGLHSVFACPRCQDLFSVEDDARGDDVECDACPWRGVGGSDGL